MDFVVEYPRHLAIGDLDGDGKPDFAAAINYSNGVSVLRNTTSSIDTLSFTFVGEFSGNPEGTSSVTIIELNEDGKPDLVVTGVDDEVVRVSGNTSTSGSISFGYGATLWVTGAPTVAIGDLDGDGRPDFGCSVPVGGDSLTRVSVFRNTSTGGGLSFGGRVDFALGTNPGG